MYWQWPSNLYHLESKVWYCPFPKTSHTPEHASSTQDHSPPLHVLWDTKSHHSNPVVRLSVNPCYKYIYFFFLTLISFYWPGYLKGNNLKAFKFTFLYHKSKTIWVWNNYYFKICENRSELEDKALTIFYSLSPHSAQFHTPSHWIHRCSFHESHNHRCDLQKAPPDNNSHWHSYCHQSVNIHQQFHSDSCRKLTL